MTETVSPPRQQGALSALKTELPLLASVATLVLFVVFEARLVGDLSNPPWLAFVFAWLFAVIIWSAFAVVRHADALAELLGEPYGTLILTLSVIGIEVMMISAVMLTGSDNPTLARDTMFAVVMIVLNGLLGVTLLLGGWRHHEQQYNLQGANAFIAVIVPLAALSLVLPRFTVSTEDASFSALQALILIVMSLALYGVFLAIQTLRHPSFFRATVAAEVEDAVHHGSPPRSVPFHALLLLAYLAPLVLLSKKLAAVLEAGIAMLGAPVALVGFVVAIIVLSPEALAAVSGALANRLQRPVNILLGSVTATIALTVPAVLAIGFLTGSKVILGLGDVDLVMLVTTLAVTLVTFTAQRTNVLLGAVHLSLFVAYVMLIFEG